MLRASHHLNSMATLKQGLSQNFTAEKKWGSENLNNLRKDIQIVNLKT